MKHFRMVTALVILGVVIAAVTAGAQSSRLISVAEWIFEDYIVSDARSIWAVEADGLTAIQRLNHTLSVFYGTAPIADDVLEATLTIEDNGDDDLVGFVVGFRPGDSHSPSAHFLLIDWKGRDQWWDFGCGKPTFAPAGLAASLVYGVPADCEFWGHMNVDVPGSDTDNGLRELQRGNTFGRTGWEAGKEYRFLFQFSADRVRVFVDGNLEIDIAGRFLSGLFGFYQFSQGGVTYSVSTSLCNDVE